METLTTRPPARARGRRPHRLGIDSHTQFVAGLVSELDAAVVSLRAAAGQVSQGDVDPSDPSRIERSVGEVNRLVRLLDTIDGPGENRRLEPLCLPDVIRQAAKDLDLGIAVRGGVTREYFYGDRESVHLGVELVLAAFAGDDGPVQVGITHDRLVVLEGALDLADERRVWQLRCGRRVLEGENCRVRLVRVPGGYRLEIRAFEP